MTLSDVSAYLQVPERTIYDWRARNIGPRSIKVGRHLRYRREDVEEWLNQQTAEQPPKPRKIRRAKAES